VERNAKKEDLMEHGKKTVYLAGIGAGTHGGLTMDVCRLLTACDVYFGAERMLSLVPENRGKKVATYLPEEIRSYLDRNEDWTSACVLFSGDVGFYSGARKLLQALDGYAVEVFPGISSLSAFCARLKIPWDEIEVVSLHGKNANVIARIVRSRYTFVLLGGMQGLRLLCGKLAYYGLDGVTVHAGERIGYEDEKIVHGSPQEIAAETFGTLLAAVVENPAPAKNPCGEIPDGEFIRGKVPMTKSEIRSLAIQKLGMGKESVLYDIGAGTGSVSVQAALAYPDSRVYAVEQKDEAAELVEQNKRKFMADNVSIVRGTAPEALEKLEAPTHAFLGGSGGRMKEILRAVWEKNPEAAVVLTSVSLETAAEIAGILKTEKVREEILQVSVAKADAAGGYHLMRGQNPILLVKLVPFRP
jgi:precorrin-6Y C5,15-methyltransferase (decarboxylating)